MEHTKHLWRAASILLVLGAAGIITRHFLIPVSFGKNGFYRANSLDDHRSQPIAHGGSSSCKKCHEEEFKTIHEGKHASVQCEVCHGPLEAHVRGGEKWADMPVNQSHEMCAYCHQKLVARPQAVSQVRIPEHLFEKEAVAPGAEIPEGVCNECLEAHDPSQD